MKSNKILSLILLIVSTISNNTAKVEAFDVTDDDTKIACIAGIAVVSLVSVGVGLYVYRSKKEKKEIARRTKEIDKLPLGKIKDIADILKDEIPISKKGNSIFDKLIECKSEIDIQKWAGISVSNSGWGSSVLMRIDNILKTAHIVCDVLKNQIDMTFRKEAEDHRNEAIANKNDRSKFGVTYDSKDGLKPVFLF
jgi:hypothetical protein